VIIFLCIVSQGNIISKNKKQLYNCSSTHSGNNELPRPTAIGSNWRQGLSILNSKRRPATRRINRSDITRIYVKPTRLNQRRGSLTPAETGSNSPACILLPGIELRTSGLQVRQAGQYTITPDNTSSSDQWQWTEATSNRDKQRQWRQQTCSDQPKRLAPRATSSDMRSWYTDWWPAATDDRDWQ